jgi:hypothetical protein
LCVELAAKKVGGMVMKTYMTLMLVVNLLIVLFSGHGYQAEKIELPFSSLFSAAASGNVIYSVQQSKLDQEYREAMEAARKLLKQPIGTPAVPPDINLKCTESVAVERLGGVYYKSLVQPEEALCQRLLLAAKQLRLVSSGAEEKASDAILTAGLLFKRNFRKVDAIIRTYKPSPEKLGAVGYASLRVYKEAALLGEKEESPMDVIGGWAARVADKYLGELRRNHDYKAISAFLQLSKLARMLGVSESEMSGLKELSAAMVFKVDFDATCWVSAGSQTVTLKGDAKLTAGQNLQLLMGEGGGKYESYAGGGGGGGRMQLPISYSVSMKLLEFKPCDGTAKLSVDRIGADNETWISPQTGERFTAPGKEVDLFVKTVVDQLFQGYRAEGGGFNFSMPISNLQAQMCTGNFTQTGTVSKSGESFSASITFNITITHTPN